MLDDLYQRDGIERCIRKLRLLQITGEHRETCSASGPCGIDGRFHAFHLKSELTRGQQERAARTADIK